MRFFPLLVIFIILNHSAVAELKKRIIDTYFEWTAMEVTDGKLATVAYFGENKIDGKETGFILRILPTGKIIDDGKLFDLPHFTIMHKSKNIVAPVNKILINGKEVKMTGKRWLSNFRFMMLEVSANKKAKLQVRGNDSDGNLYKISIPTWGWDNASTEGTKVMVKHGLNWAK